MLLEEEFMTSRIYGLQNNNNNNNNNISVYCVSILKSPLSQNNVAEISVLVWILITEAARGTRLKRALALG